MAGVRLAPKVAARRPPPRGGARELGAARRSRLIRSLALAALLLGCAGAAQAMPVLLAVVATYAVQAALTYGVILATTALALNAAIFVGTLAYGAVQQRRAKSQARNAYNASLTDRYAPVMSAAQAPWQVIYGECVVAPCQVAAQLTSGSRDEFKHVVYVWAAHQCQAITDTLIAGVSVGALDANGWVTGGKYFRTRTEESEPLGATLNGSGSTTLAYAPGQVLNIAYSTGVGEDDLWQYLTAGQFTLVGAVLTVAAPYVATWAGRNVTVNTLRTVNNSVLRVRHHLGTAGQTADSALLAEVPADWSASDKLANLCYSVVTYALDEPEFQAGPPDLKVRVKGKLLYDDRSGTTVWSANPTLAIRDFLRAEYGKHCAANQLDTASNIASANICDEALASQGGAKRYTVNGAFRTDMDPDATLDALCQAMGGFVSFDGGKWSPQAGAYSAPVQALTDADNWGSVEALADKTGDETFNGLKGRFFDPARFDQLTDYTPYQNAAFVTADGAELWSDLDLPFTTAQWRAQNLARILVERSRGMQLVFPAKLSAIKRKVGERVTLTNSVLGISGAVFRVVKREYVVGGPVKLTLQQDDPTIWDEADAVAPLASPAADAPDPFYVAPVAGLTLTSGDSMRQTAADGTVVSRMMVTVTASIDAQVTAHGALQIEYRLDNVTTWLRWPEQPGTTTQVILDGLKDGRRYVVRARWRNGVGAVGDWRVADVLVSGKTAGPADATGLTGSVALGQIRWKWDESQDSDYARTEARLGGTNWATAATPPIFSGLANSFVQRVSAAGSYTLRVKHFNRSGKESTNAASATVTVVAADLVGVPDLTAPPTPTGLAVTAGLTHIYVECAAQVYTQGHGHDVTIVYGAQWPSGSAPIFSAAVELFRFSGTFGAYPSPIGTRWCIWIKWQSIDGVMSVSPAGGTNGVQATTGKIGNADLGPLLITADKLSQGLYPQTNLVPNPGAEDGTEAWALAVAGTGTTTLTSDTSQKTSGSRSFKISKTVLTDGQGWGCRAFPVIPGETYAVKIKRKASSATASGFYLWAFGRATAPAGGYVTGSGGADPYDNSSAIINNAAMTTSWVGFSDTYTVPAGLYWLSLVVYDWYTLGANSVYFDDVQFGRQITAEFIAANAIAVGTAAIQNGAIVNAMLGNASVDNAKIANLAVDNAKIANGTISNAKIANLAVDSAKIANLAVDTIKIANQAVDVTKIGAGAVSKAITGSVSGLSRSVSTVTSRTSSKTIGAITTDADGDGRVMLFVFPTDEGAFVYYGYLIEASIGDLIYGDTYTIDFAITRTVGAAVTTVYDQSTTWTHTGGAGETVTRFSYVSHLADTPGAGVTATYKIVITTTASGAAVKMAREVVAFNYSLIEYKR